MLNMFAPITTMPITVSIVEDDAGVEVGGGHQAALLARATSAAVMT